MEDFYETRIDGVDGEMASCSKMFALLNSLGSGSRSDLP